MRIWLLSEATPPRIRLGRHRGSGFGLSVSTKTLFIFFVSTVYTPPFWTLTTFDLGLPVWEKEQSWGGKTAIFFLLLPSKLNDSNK